MKRVLDRTKHYLKRWWLSLFLVVLFIMLKNLNFNLIPDWLNVASIKPNEYFNIIIGATASVFGIWITIILLTFELVKHTLYKSRDENIFNKPFITNFLSLGIVTIVLSLISYVTVQDLSIPQNITVIYFISYIFVIFLLTIYPAMKSVLESTSGLKRAQTLVQELQLSDFQLRDFETNSVSLLEDSSSRLFGIRTELIDAVRENDFEAYNKLLFSLNRKVIELIGDGSDRGAMDRIFRSLSLIWKGCNLEALRVENYQYFDSVWESILTLFANAADKKHPLLHYQAFEFYIDDFIRFLSRNRLNDNLATGAKTLSNSFRFNLEVNCPPQESIWDLYTQFNIEGGESHNSMTSLQWDAINHLLSLISRIQEVAIENRDRDLYETCQSEINIILSRIRYNEFPDLKELQEAHLVIHIIGTELHIAQKAMEEKLFNEQYRTYSMPYHMIAEAIEQEKLYVKYILPKIGDFLILCQRKESLEYFSVLDSWGIIPRYISKHYGKHQLGQKAMDYIIKTLEVMKKEIEEKQLPQQTKNYYEIKNILKMLRDTLVKDNGNSVAALTDRLDAVLNEFKDVPQVKDFRIVDWKME